MKTTHKHTAGQAVWMLFTAAGAFVSAALRWWQLRTAFEEGTGLAISFAPASVVLTCVLVMAAAWFLLLAIHQPIGRIGPEQRWDLAFLDAGDLIYPVLAILAAFLTLAAVPFLLRTGIDQWRAYQEALAAKKLNSSVQLPSSNGALTIGTAVGALLAFLGLLQLGRDGFRPGRRGKGGFSAVLPGVAGCIWLMESFRGHAANPVRWDYAPLLVAIVSGMLFFMDFAGVSAGAGRPRRLLWMAAMVLVLSAPALVSAVAEQSLADVLLLSAQGLAAAAVLWRLPPKLQYPPKVKGTPIPKPGEASIQEETTDE